ncbi:hypothetical protein HYDPIDRAFT_106270 [Hydnomerulius pinastri MD-312]|nr:hypothetical protein HYDPIDRAFT_106270 [Hydnomerulius pinastri MD-312]
MFYNAAIPSLCPPRIVREDVYFVRRRAYRPPLPLHWECSMLYTFCSPGTAFFQLFLLATAFPVFPRSSHMDSLGYRS